LTRALIVCSANWRSNGSLELRISSTVGLPTPWVTRLSIWAGMSDGTINAAAAWPERTLEIASSRELTFTGLIESNSCLAYWEMLIFWLPNRMVPWPGGTWLRIATVGLPGGLDSANPIISAIAIG
jgi:hypothetical protein